MNSRIESVEIDEIENYLSYIRPKEDVRDKLDIAYKIEKQSIIIFEVRPDWNDSTQKLANNVAKATFVKKDKNWKLYWRRADLKWHSYKPNPVVKNLLDFVRILEKDEYNCFWG